MTRNTFGVIDSEDGIVRFPQVCELVGDVDRTTLWRWSRDPRVGFPRPVKLGAGRQGAIGWRVVEVRDWLRTRREQSEPADGSSANRHD